MTTSQISDPANGAPAGVSETGDQDFDLFGLSPMDAFVADKIGDLIDKLQAAYLDEQEVRKITRADIAKALDVNRSQITHILQGRRNITLRTLFQLLYCLDRNPQIAFPSAARQPVQALPSTTAATRVSGLLSQSVPEMGTMLANTSAGSQGIGATVTTEPGRHVPTPDVTAGTAPISDKAWPPQSDLSAAAAAAIALLEERMSQSRNDNVKIPRHSQTSQPVLELNEAYA